MTFADVLSSAPAIFIDPALLGAMVVGMSMGMVFGAAPGLGAKMGILLLMPMLFSMERAPLARSGRCRPRCSPGRRALVG